MSNDTLGRYRLLSELGRGAMGHVFLAHDPEIDRNVALKTIQILGALAQSDQQETRDRVLREARAAGKLIHPGIVTLFDVGETEGMLYLAMEFVEGETLDEFCRPERLLPLAEVVEMIAGIAEALEYAHHLGIVHRDIKPANLMRVGKGRAKIMDFGLARIGEGQITQDGALMGTPSYMAPEQIRGATVNARSDLFSLAVVLFELLSGERPFPGDSISSIIYRIVNEPPHDPAVLVEKVPQPLRAFLSRALSKDPDDRFPQGGAFAAALRIAAQGLDVLPAAQDALEMPTATPETALPPRRSSHKKKSSALPFVLVLVLLAGLAAAGWHFRDRLPLDRLRPAAEVVWLETFVSSEPPGLKLFVDGEPAAAGVVRYAAGGAPVVVSARSGCREVSQQLEATDAGGEVLLLVESERFAGPFESTVAGSQVTLNGQSLGAAPLALSLDLCRENTLVVSAPGYRDTTLRIEAQARPVDVRATLAAVTLDAIPQGKLVLGDTNVPFVYYIDGQRQDKNQREFDLPEGTHSVRFKNQGYWIDVTREFEIQAGETTTPDLNAPALTTLVVQAFPANCKVFLRKPGGRWEYIDDTPAEKKLASGTYELRVTFNPTGENRDQLIKLSPGPNPPVRVKFSGTQG